MFLGISKFKTNAPYTSVSKTSRTQLAVLRGTYLAVSEDP